MHVKTDDALIENIFKGFMLFLNKYKKRVDWHLSQNEALPLTAKYKFCLVTGKTLKVDLTEAESNPFPKDNSLKPCLACNKDGVTNSEGTRHPMASCDLWNNLSLEDKKGLVGCLKHPFSKTHSTEDCVKNIRPCQNCHNTNHHFLLCSKKITLSNKAFCKSSSSYSEVLLKTLFVKGKDPNKILGVIEDNCSSDNYITFAKAEDLRLKGTHITLEIEGINSTTIIESKIFKVTIRDKQGKIHVIECYGLDSIAKDSPPPNVASYTKLCDTFGVDADEVRRPRKQ